MTNAVSGLSAALFRDETKKYAVTPALGDARDICFVSADDEANKVEIIVGATTAPLSLSVSGTKLTITSANVDGTATSTAAEIVDAVNEDVGASALFTARLPPGSKGGGVTGALAEVTAADGVAFTGLELVDSGDHLIYQAASNLRYWDDRYSLTVKSDGVTVTSGFKVNFLRGMVTFDNSMEGHTITIDGTRRSILAFEKILGVFDGKLSIKGTDIDSSSVDDDGWGSSTTGSRRFEITSGLYYYDGKIPLEALTTKYIWKFYSVLNDDVPFAVGKGIAQTTEHLLASATDVQKTTITVRGAGELYIE
jgi:hypothetical protein